MFCRPLTPQAVSTPAVVNTMVALSLIAIIYGALICLVQRASWKKLVAYYWKLTLALHAGVFSP